jgi:hypothetical protein
MRYFPVLLRAVFTAALFGIAVASTGPATAAVYSSRQALSQEAIQSFLANPSGLLAQFPDGGALMITRVRDLAASDPATLNALIGLLKSANPQQATAIGTALGQVALMAVATDQPFAGEIQTDIAQAGNNSALVAFSAVVGGDIKLAAATGPGAGIGGGGESQTVTNPGTFGGFLGTALDLSTAVKNTPDSFTTPSFSSSTPGTGTTTFSVVTTTNTTTPGTSTSPF